jgi:tRNA(Ile)-lysidine synthase
MLEQVREGGLLSGGSPLVAMLSGGRDSVCLLDLAVRLLGAEAVTALHVNYGLREGSGAEEEHSAGAWASVSRSSDPSAPRAPATCRPGRATCATRPPPASPSAATA